jgi:hypothetical protein
MHADLQRYRCVICHQVWWTRTPHYVTHRHWCRRCQHTRLFEYCPPKTWTPWPPPARPERREGKA